MDLELTSVLSFLPPHWDPTPLTFIVLDVIPSLKSLNFMVHNYNHFLVGRKGLPAGSVSVPLASQTEN